MDLSDLKRKSIHELIAMAEQLRIEDSNDLDRQELIFALLDAHSDRRGEITAEGVIEVLQDGFGFLRAPDHNYLPGADDIYVSPSQIRRFNLRTGDTVAGQIRPPKESERYFALLKVHAVNGETPDRERNGILFDNLTPVHPRDRFHLEHERGELTTRIIDLVCPLGHGQRCLVAAPPHTGQLELLRDIARALERNHPDVATIVLTIDQRPEDVTDMRRSVSCEVIASTFDEPPARHIQVAEIVLAKARRLAENGKHVAVLVDSLTKLARAYDATLPGSDKVLASGVDPNAIHKSKRFVGAARNLEEGGSLTMVATARVDSDTPGDQAIFDAFAGTANAEIRLDRALAEQRLFPCIDLARTRTRRDELLVSGDVLDTVRAMRLDLGPLGAAEALARLRLRLSRAATNAAFLESLAKQSLSRDAAED